ncbi:MAG: type I methionyl aminopeptidase [Armatimonadetes bacterium]|nr:type I methionyl aminopeptidase [Armatimonadota bacterium]
MIIIKNESQIAKMRKAGQIVARALRECAEAIEPGKTTTLSLNYLAERITLQMGGFPAFKGYRGYPASLCVSVNEEIVHGIPGPRVLEEGDIVGLDMGVVYDGLIGDAAITAPVGKIDEATEKLLKVTQQALAAGLAMATPEYRVGDISNAIQRTAESQGYSLAEGLQGHGVGVNVHEEPSVPNIGRPGKGPRLRPGMTIAIEPMVCMGRPQTVCLPDQWTVVTRDGCPSAHFEHTVAITETGCEILTIE